VPPLNRPSTHHASNLTGPDPSVAEQSRDNVHIREGISQEEFVTMRLARDSTLEAPLLILPSLQVNIRAGAMPPATDKGHVYLKLPINAI